MDETSHAFRASQRSAANLTLHFFVGVLVVLLPQVPGMTQLLGLTSLQLAKWVGASFAATAVATFLYYRVGETTRLYGIFALLEASTLQLGSVFMIVWSGRGTSLLWLGYIAFATLEAGITEARIIIGALVLLPPLGASLAFLLLHHDVAGAVACVLVDAISALVFFASSRAHVQRERALAELAELRLREERSRIARDLHDGAAADLAAIVWRAEALRAKAKDDVAQRAALEALVARASEGIDEVRSVVWSLRRDAQPWNELVAYLRQRTQELCEGRVRCSIEANDSSRVVPGALVVEILRIVQESVRNAIRHAGAQRIDVHLAWDDVLTITVEDDGRGIPPEVLAAAESKRSGLWNIRVRAESCGGTAHITSKGAGTLVEVRIP